MLARRVCTYNGANAKRLCSFARSLLAPLARLTRLSLEIYSWTEAELAGECWEWLLGNYGIR